MDWDLKTPSWDLTELEPELMPNMAPLVGFNNLGGQKSKGECSVDLKLGRLEDFGDGSQDKLKDPRVSMNVSSSSGSSKTARVPNGTQIVSCLVDGCKSDLSQCKDYHRRHKVCEVHSKAPTVMVGGQAQRFCQQCSRFHLLAEFDEAKRSCRKRLDGHNRRRRKPQPESPSMNSRSSFSNHQGSKLLPFSSPQIFPTSVVSPTWAGVVKTEEDATIYNCYQQLVDNPQNPFFGSFSFNYKGGGEQFPFSHSNNSTLISQTAPGASVGQALLNTISSSGGEGSRKMFSNGLTKVLDSDCALSLLSTPLTQTPGISLNHMVEAEPIPMALPLVPSLQYSDQGQYACSRGMEDEQVGSVLLTNASDADRHCQGIFHVGSDGSSRNGGLQMFPSLGSSYDSCGCPRL